MITQQPVVRSYTKRYGDETIRNNWDGLCYIIIIARLTVSQKVQHSYHMYCKLTYLQLFSSNKTISPIKFDTHYIEQQLHFGRYW